MFVVVFYFGTYISWANIHFFSFSLLFSFLYFASIVPSFCDPPYFYFSFSYLQLDYFFLFLSHASTSHPLFLLTLSTSFSCLHFSPPSLAFTSHLLLLPPLPTPFSCRIENVCHSTSFVLFHSIYGITI